MDESQSTHPGWRTLLAVTLAYAVCAAVATYPVCLTFFSRFPCHRTDALQALWVMRNYQDSLAEGRLPFDCPNVQAPVGGRLGNWSPMHFQALLYLPLAGVLPNDVACYNLIWLGNLVFTGVGTFVLIWQLLRSRLAAFYGGLSAMLAGPVMLHAMGHLELITLGWVPLFLAAWLRWIDRPTLRGMFAVVGLYLLVAMSAAYFAVFALIPATLYVLRADLLRRLGWLTLFATATLPCLLLVFSAQLDARSRGFSTPRPREEFLHYGTPLWTYLAPSTYHTAWKWLPIQPYATKELDFETERCSYYGLATLGLIGCALVAGAPLRRRWFWWMLLIVLVVLSLGGKFTWGRLAFDLPARWLYDWFPPFQQLRVPARFNLFAGLVAAVLASSGLAWLLRSIPQLRMRVGFVAMLAGLTVVDLAVTPNVEQGRELPEMPGCYAYLQRTAPQATILEAPHFSSGAAVDLHARFTYWQSLHRLRTSAGYSGFANARYEGFVHEPSPFTATRLREANAWQETDLTTVDLVREVELEDSAWLYLHVHGFTHLVVHDAPEAGYHVAALKARLQSAQVYSDDRSTVYSAARLPMPDRPTLLCTHGWRVRRLFWRKGGAPILTRTAPIGADARLAVWNPEADEPLRFTFDAVAVREPRQVRLLADGKELASWTIEAKAAGSYTTGPFHLPTGCSELTLLSDGEAVAARGEEAGWYEKTPTSLWVTGVRLARASTTSVE